MTTYNVKQIAEMLNTNPETVRRWIRSGKLKAVQDSRKTGNVVTEQMLEAFIKSTPKYAGTIVGTSALGGAYVGLVASAAALIGGIFVQKNAENKRIANAKVKPEEIKKLLRENIKAREKTIMQKEQAIKQLENEIQAEKNNVLASKNLILQIDSDVAEISKEKDGM